MSDNFVIWQYRSEPHAAVLKKLTGIGKLFRFKNGTPLQKDFPTDVQYHMHPDFPNDLALVDNMLNIHELAVTSARLKDAIENRSPTNMEYLPIAIVDHKGRVASTDYFIVHPLGLVDCIDRDQSVYEPDTIDPDNMEFVKRLVIDETRIPSDRKIFRLQGFRDVLITRRDVADTLDQGKFTGLSWQRLPDYSGK